MKGHHSSKRCQSRLLVNLEVAHSSLNGESRRQAEEARITCAIVDAAACVRDLNFKYLAEGKGAIVTARFCAGKVFQRIYDKSIRSREGVAQCVMRSGCAAKRSFTLRALSRREDRDVVESNGAAGLVGEGGCGEAHVGGLGEFHGLGAGLGPLLSVCGAIGGDGVALPHEAHPVGSAATLECAGSVSAAREKALRTRSCSARFARSKPSGSSSAHGLSAACSSRLVSESMTSAPDRASASPSSMRNAPMEPDSARTVRTSAVHFDGPAAQRPSARAATSRNSTRCGMSSSERASSLVAVTCTRFVRSAPMSMPSSDSASRTTPASDRSGRPFAK